ncbi:hypothetical protein KEJ49_06450 [Candidatus Bathyarchaeota archaeon]|nr:hypothetical protein [Candidatus Bathyarchaeota archaeon]MBS7638502.1 hypothetical protein [Candidatus Bathyarchaeota archaeon]
MRQYLGVTIDPELFEELDSLRSRMKRSTFVEYLLRLGLREYKRLRSPGRAPPRSSSSTPVSRP